MNKAIIQLDPNAVHERCQCWMISMTKEIVALVLLDDTFHSDVLHIRYF